MRDYAEAHTVTMSQTPEQVAEKILHLIQSGEERADLVPAQFGGSYQG